VTTILIAVPAEQQRHLERSFFWRSDMRRTVASPAELLSVARTLGPDVIVVAPDGDDLVSRIGQIRQEASTRDSVIVLLCDEAGDLVTNDPATLVLPTDFDETDAEQPEPWHERVEELLRVRRRRDTRVVAEFDVDFWRDDSGERKQSKAHAMNLSSRGVLLALAEPMELTTRLELAFAAGLGLPHVSVVGEIVRIAETADRRWLAGVHFVVVRKDARIAIRDTLRALRPEGESVEEGR
jgi:hypothetical protein